MLFSVENFKKCIDNITRFYAAKKNKMSIIIWQPTVHATENFVTFYENSLKFHNIKINFRKFGTFFAILRYLHLKTSFVEFYVTFVTYKLCKFPKISNSVYKKRVNRTEIFVKFSEMLRYNYLNL